jgi:DNA-directed RNA polymerase beta' subunit
MAKEENPLFVGITEGDELRRSMLECSKDILESLKEHEKLKNVREEKMTLIHQFKRDIRELSRSINALRTYLPKAKDAGIKRQSIKTSKKPKMVKVEKPAKTAIERLESELNDIEDRLKNIS